MATKFLVTVSAALFTACATNQAGYTEPDEVTARLNQLDETEVIMMMGAPTEVMELSDGVKAWTYRDDIDGLTGGECAITVVIKDQQVIRANVAARDASWVSFPLGSCKNLLANLN